MARGAPRRALQEQPLRRRLGSSMRCLALAIMLGPSPAVANEVADPLPSHGCITLPDVYGFSDQPQYGDVWTSSQLSAAGFLNAFIADDMATFSTTLTSTCTSDLVFGGSGGGGWLVFVAPAGATAITIEQTGPIVEVQPDTRFEVRTNTGVPEECSVTFTSTQICPAIAPRAEYDACRLQITACKAPEESDVKYVQLAEVTLYEGHRGVAMTKTSQGFPGSTTGIVETSIQHRQAMVTRSSITVTNPGGVSPSGEEEDAVMDGDTATKWLQYNGACGFCDPAHEASHCSPPLVDSILQFDFSRPATIGAYDLTTASDNPDRDPIGWTLECRLAPPPGAPPPGTPPSPPPPWLMLDTVSYFSSPSARETEYNPSTTAFPYGDFRTRFVLPSCGGCAECAYVVSSRARTDGSQDNEHAFVGHPGFIASFHECAGLEEAEGTMAEEKARACSMSNTGNSMARVLRVDYKGIVGVGVTCCDNPTEWVAPMSITSVCAMPPSAPPTPPEPPFGPPPSPLAPGESLVDVVVLYFTIAGNKETFDQAAFRIRVARHLRVAVGQVSVSVDLSSPPPPSLPPSLPPPPTMPPPLAPGVYESSTGVCKDADGDSLDDVKDAQNQPMVFTGVSKEYCQQLCTLEPQCEFAQHFPTGDNAGELVCKLKYCIKFTSGTPCTRPVTGDDVVGSGGIDAPATCNVKQNAGAGTRRLGDDVEDGSLSEGERFLRRLTHMSTGPLTTFLVTVSIAPYSAGLHHQAGTFSCTSLVDCAAQSQYLNVSVYSVATPALRTDDVVPAPTLTASMPPLPPRQHERQCVVEIRVRKQCRVTINMFSSWGCANLDHPTIYEVLTKCDERCTAANIVPERTIYHKLINAGGGFGHVGGMCSCCEVSRIAGP